MVANNFMDDERFDGLYLNVAQTTKGIEPLLDSVFSFLRRKTDFFNGPDGQGTNTAVAKVNEVLSKHVKLHNDALAKKKIEEEAKEKKQRKSKAKSKAEDSRSKSSGKNDKDADIIEIGSDGFDISSSNNDNEVIKKSPPKSETRKDFENPKSQDPEPSKKNIKVSEDNEEESDDSPPPIGNGGKVDGKYEWTQTLSEVNVSVGLPDNTRGRDLNVIIGKKRLRVSLKNSKDAIIDAPLTKSIIVDDSFWTVEDGNRLAINLQKQNGMEWWDSVCVGDPCIDIKKVQPENSKLGDLDGDTRQTVEKMMFDQRQKAMGLPTSEEQKKFDMLEKFKKSHPEMDFSNAKMF